MRRKDKEIGDPSEINDILKTAKTVRLAMADEGEPYIVPLNYGYHDHALYIHCAKEGRKLDILRKNPRVCFEIEGKSELVTGETACQWTMNYRSLIGYGTVEILESEEEKIAGLDILMQHFGSFNNTYHPKHIANIVMLKITIESVTGKMSVS
jgi:nitroimidazol reductase NimA-like FMN-containing flavoprotein (pyridoxamine 5'-phosphate oxidase superfamily)